MVETDRTTPGRYIDLAAQPPDELLKLIGELTVMFGRLEYMVRLAIKRKRNLSIAQALDFYNNYSLGAKLNGQTSCKQAGEMCRYFGSRQGLTHLGQ